MEWNTLERAIKKNKQTTTTAKKNKKKRLKNRIERVGKLGWFMSDINRNILTCEGEPAGIIVNKVNLSPLPYYVIWLHTHAIFKPAYWYLSWVCLGGALCCKLNLFYIELSLERLWQGQKFHVQIQNLYSPSFSTRNVSRSKVRTQT